MIEDHEITTEQILQKLDLIDNLTHDVIEVKRRLEKDYQTYQWCIENEKKVEEEHAANPKSKEIREKAKILRLQAEERFKDH